MTPPRTRQGASNPSGARVAKHTQPSAAKSQKAAEDASYFLCIELLRGLDSDQQPAALASVTECQSLLQASLVDELRLVIAPAVHTHGRKLFDHANAKRLTLTRSIVSPTGYPLVDFQVRN